MYHLRLCRGLSYTGVVTATREEPDVFTEDEAIAEQAVASGYFVLIEDDCEVAEPEQERDPYKKEQLDDMTVEQLRKVAAEVGVAETKGFKKADYVDAILWAEGDYSTGSPTMIDLQKE